MEGSSITRAGTWRGQAENQAIRWCRHRGRDEPPVTSKCWSARAISRRDKSGSARASPGGPFRATLMMLAVAAAMLVAAPAAFAQSDTFITGDGHDGVYAAPAGMTTVINSVAPVSGAVTAGAGGVVSGTGARGP